MGLNKRSLSFAAVLLVALAAFVAACTDRGDPLLPPPPPGPTPPPPSLAAIKCTGSVGQRTVTCAPAPPSTGGVSADILLGEQRVNVELASNDVAVTVNGADTTFAFDVNVRNILPPRQLLGTTDTTPGDGITPDPDGIKVFFHDEPTSLDVGVVTVKTDSVRSFTKAANKFYKYAEVLDSNEVSTDVRWELDLSGGVQNFTFLVYVSAPVPYPQGWIDVTPAVDTVAVGDSVQLTARVFNHIGRRLPASPLEWTSSDPAVLTVGAADSVVWVKGVTKGAVTVTACSPNCAGAGTRKGTATIVVNTGVQPVNDAFDVIGNLTLARDSANGLLKNDQTLLDLGERIRVVPQNIDNDSVYFAVDSTGAFEFIAKRHQTAPRVIRYKINDGVAVDSATVTFTPLYHVWYVNVNGAAGGEGTDKVPFGTLDLAAAAAEPVDSIFVKSGAGTLVVGAAATLKPGQVVLGQGPGVTIKAPLNADSVVLLGPGDRPTVRAASGTAITLSTNNTLRRIDVVGANGAGIASGSSGFGTLTATQVSASATNGAALDLTNGTLAASTDLDSLSSTGSAGNGVRLAQVAGTLVVNGGTVRNSTGAALALDNSTANVTYRGNLEQSSGSGRLLSLNADSSTVTFENGALSATVGDGMRFTGAEGSYTFSGSTVLNGGNAGISIESGSTATIAFGNGLRLRNPSGAAVVVNGSTPALTFTGGVIKQDNAALLVDITGQAPSARSITFGLDSLAATNGAGIRLSDVDGTVTFTGTVHLTSDAPAEDVGIDVIGGSDGVISFGAGTQISNPSGIALNVNGGTPALTFAGNIVANTGRPVVVDGITADSVVITGGVTSFDGGLGILAQNNTGGTVAFRGTSKVLATAAAEAVTLANNTGATIEFTGGGLLIQTDGANGFSAAGGGTVRVTGPNNTITTNNGIALSVVGTQIGGVNGLDFQSVSDNGGTSGIVLNGTGAGTLRVAAGRIENNTTYGVRLENAGGAELGGLDVLSNVSGSVGISGSVFGTLTVAVDSLNVTGGQALSLTDGIINGSFALLGSSGSANNGVALTRVNGSFTAAGGAISGSTGSAFAVADSAVSVTYGGTISQNNTSPLLGVSSHRGTLQFTGSLTTAAGSPGLRFSDADGSYTLTTATLSGDSAGVDILRGSDSANGSTGTFVFGNGVSITGTAGTAFNVDGSSPDVTFSGGITKGAGTAGHLVSITDQASSARDIVFQTGTLLANAGSGIQFSNADGAVSFNGTTTLSNTAVGANAGIDVVNGSAGTFTFGTGTTVTSPNGIAIDVQGGTASLNFNGNATQANNFALLSVNGGHAGGTLAFATGTLTATNGSGLQFNNADGTYDFDGTLSFTNSVGGASADAGIDVTNGSGGTFTIADGTGSAAIGNPFGTAVTVNGSSPTFTYGGTINKTNGGTGINVASSGGTVTFSGSAKTITSGASIAVSLTNNTGAINFSGGGLAITTTSGNGFDATGGGTVQVHGANNTVQSGTGTAVRIQNTVIGQPNGVVFRSVTHSGGANGIYLENTTSGGTSGGFAVGPTTGAVGDGGTIQNTTGADNAPAGSGVYLSNTRDVTLRRMQLNDHANYAVRGSGVVNFTMERTRISGTNGTSAGPDEGGLNFTQLTGTAAVTASNISGGFEDNVRIVNTSGTLGLTFADDTIGANGTAEGGDGINVGPTGTATINVTVQNSRFTSARGDWFNLHVENTGVSALTFTGNTLTNNHPNIVAGGGGMTISAGGAGSATTLTYNITGNSMRDSKGTALVIYKGSGAGTASGTIANNTIGVAGVTNSGSSEASGIDVTVLNQGTHTVKMTGNQIRQYNQFAILLTAGGANMNPGQPNNAALNATITGNTVSNPGTLGSLTTNGIQLNAGTTSNSTVTGGTPDQYQVCLDVGGAGALSNSMANTGLNGGQDLRLRQRFSTTVRLPGYGGANNNDAAVQGYLSGRNTVASTAVSNNVAGGGGGYVGGAACPQP